MRRTWLLMLTSLTMLLVGGFSAGAARAAVSVDDPSAATQAPAIPEAASAAACGIGRLQGPARISTTLSSGYLVYNNCGADTYARVAILNGSRKSQCFKVRARDAHLFAMAYDDRNWTVERCSSGYNIAAKPSHGSNPCIWRVESAAPVPPGANAYTVFNGCSQAHHFRIYFPTSGDRTTCALVAAKKYAWLGYKLPTGNWVVEGCTP
jgi:hypothetical protein